MRLITAFAWLVAGATVLPACSRDLQAMDAQQIEATYGISGAFADTVATPDGPVKGMRVPITLANGSPGHLFIPERQANDLQSVYLQDEQGLHPLLLGANVSRTEMAASPRIVETRQAPQGKRTRSWEREVLIIGGGAGAGTAIGALAGGKKGAGVGAAAGGIGALIYDLATRSKK